MKMKKVCVWCHKPSSEGSPNQFGNFECMDCIDKQSIYGPGEFSPSDGILSERERMARHAGSETEEKQMAIAEIAKLIDARMSGRGGRTVQVGDSLHFSTGTPGETLDITMTPELIAAAEDVLRHEGGA